MLPSRIVCLSAESADFLFRLGAWERVAGVTAFYQQPPRAVKKPVVSGFSKADLEEIAGRPGWNRIRAVQEGRVFEIPARYILQPGYPLVVGYRELKRIIQGGDS